MTSASTERDIAAHFPVPEEIQRLADKANTDLYFGPTYYDGDGNQCSMFDEVENGVTAFNFSEACAQVSDWCGDNLHTVYTDCGEVLDTEPQAEEDEDGNWIHPLPYYEISTQEIKRMLFGVELAGHI